MSGDLSIAIAIFLVSAAAVIYFGALLAKYGDALATLTGWGRLFVGSILLALATSLPELSTNISAVRLDPPNPELALGNILGYAGCGTEWASGRGNLVENPTVRPRDLGPDWGVLSCGRCLRR